MRAARLLGTHTAEEWAEILDRHNHACAICGIPASELIGGRLTKDHITAISLGGSDAATNLRPLCRECNTAAYQASQR
jgi:5-methylcytosine-specific restriction endonuclease McrA